MPDHDTYAYSAAKAGLHHLSRHLAGRLGPEGIVSNTIACGESDLSFTPGELTSRVDVAQAHSKARVSSSRFISIIGVLFT